MVEKEILSFALMEDLWVRMPKLEKKRKSSLEERFFNANKNMVHMSSIGYIFVLVNCCMNANNYV